MRIFQVFMGLGLLVSIAALGVIAFRSVVERRQQIGMLRAVGCHRGTVATSFLLESSFIASMVSSPAWWGRRSLLQPVELRNIRLAGVPTDLLHSLGRVTAFIVIAFGFALLMTWW
jgi:putative ABC transport system permease protein